MLPIRYLPLTLIVMLAIAVIVLVAYDPDDPDGQLEDVVSRVLDGDSGSRAERTVWPGGPRLPDCECSQQTGQM